MKTLKLTLTKKWFEMILTGEKTEEYRTIGDYWSARIMERVESGYRYKQFDQVEFTNGYAANSPRAVFKINGIRTQKGNPLWGANPGEHYHTIQLGEYVSEFMVDPILSERATVERQVRRLYSQMIDPQPGYKPEPLTPREQLMISVMLSTIYNGKMPGVIVVAKMDLVHLEALRDIASHWVPRANQQAVDGVQELHDKMETVIHPEK